MAACENEFGAALLDAIPYPVIVLDVKGRITRFNRTCEEASGLSRLQVLGHAFWSVLDSAAAEAAKSAMADVIAANSARALEADFAARSTGGGRFAWRLAPVSIDNTQYLVATGAELTGGPSRDLAAGKPDSVSQTQDALRESKRRLQLIVDNSPDLVFEQDTQLRLTWISRMSDLLQPNQLIGKADRDFVGAEEAQRLAEIKNRVMRSGAPEKFECGLEYGGRWFDFELIAQRRLDSKGAVAGVTCYARDITGRKRAEKELRSLNAELQALNATLESRIAERTSAVEEHSRQLERSEQALKDHTRVLRSILDSMGDGVMVSDNEAHFVLMNPAVQRIMGMGVTQELMHRRPAHYGLYLPDMKTLYPPEELPLARALRGEAVDDAEVFLRNASRPDGVWITITARPLIGEGGVIEGGVMVMRDTTQRRHAEEELRFRKSLLEAQTEASIEGILVVAEDGRIVSFNRRFAQMWDIPTDVLALQSDDAALQHVRDNLLDPDEYMRRVDHLYRHPLEYGREEVLLRDGRTFDRYSAPITAPDGAYYGRVWFFRDVTARRRAEDAQRRLAERYRRLALEVDHRVGNNLAGLLGLVAEMKQRTTDVAVFAAALEGRLMGMGTVHRLLTDAGWESVELRSLVQSAAAAMERIAPFQAKLVLEGPPVPLAPRQAVTLMMILVEWFTNSSKYGAHSAPGGTVMVLWESLPGDQGRDLRLRWKEVDGPRTTTPGTTSLGTDLVNAFVTRELRGRCTIEYPPDGAAYELSFCTQDHAGDGAAAAEEQEAQIP